MKRIAAILLAAAMVMTLCACGGSNAPSGGSDTPSRGQSAPLSNINSEETARAVELYQKYSGIIDRLENQDYTGAIHEIAVLSNAGKEQEPTTPITELFTGEWHLTDKGEEKHNPPKKVTLSNNGTITLDGTAYTWLEQSSHDTGISGWLLKDGVHTWYLSLNKSEENLVPQIQIYTVKQNKDGSYNTDDWVGTYYNDVMMCYLLRSWYNLDNNDKVMPNSFSVGRSYASIKSEEHIWSVTSSENGKIALKLGDAYTFAMELRGEQPIALLTETATGNSAAYYSDFYKYDRSWPEFIYPRAVQYLNNCQEDVANGYSVGFTSYLKEEYESYSGNAAWKFLYDVFTNLGSYKDSADIVGRFTILKDMYTGAKIDRVDHMGNKSNGEYEIMKYNKLGQLIRGMSKELVRMYGMYESSNTYLYYDDAGRVSSVEMGSGNNVSIVITPSYDAQGRMVSATYKSNSQNHEYSYKYDDQGRLVENTVWNSNDRYQYTYTYDANGRLTKQVCLYGWNESNNYKNYRYTTDFTYDAQGNLIQSVEVRESYSSNWDEYHFQQKTAITYTNDAQGRPVSASIKVENANNNYSYASETVTYTYEDLYFFD